MKVRRITPSLDGMGVVRKMKEKQKIEVYPAGLKWTKQRKRVYQILKEATEPLSAAQIYARMESWEQEQYAMEHDFSPQR